MNLRRVILESPYSGDVDRNLKYLRAAMRDCIQRGEAPYASHGLYTQPGVLNDDDPAQRMLGIEAGFCWRTSADATVCYIDLGISQGMEDGIKDAIKKGQQIELRLVKGWEG